MEAAIPMDNKLILSPIELRELMDAVRAVVREELKHQHETEQSHELLTAREAAKFLKISQVTLWYWVNHGRLQKHKIGGRVYFKHSEIMASIENLQPYVKPNMRRAKP
jgi:excisionase family DNA binding protein